MTNIDTQRRALNQSQTKLRKTLNAKNTSAQAVASYLQQHAMLHAAKMSASGLWSFEDAILDDMGEDHIRRIPANQEHSVAWCIWHIARIEDVVMNRLVAGTPQLFLKDDWAARLGVPYIDTGNEMSSEAMIDFSAGVDVAALRDYRLAVGQRTRDIVLELDPAQLHSNVAPQRLEDVRADGAVPEAAEGIIQYWSKRTLAGLLLTPGSRHQLTHLNEALALKRRR